MPLRRSAGKRAATTTRKSRTTRSKRRVVQSSSDDAASQDDVLEPSRSTSPELDDATVAEDQFAQAMEAGNDSVTAGQPPQQISDCVDKEIENAKDEEEMFCDNLSDIADLVGNSGFIGEEGASNADVVSGDWRLDSHEGLNQHLVTEEPSVCKREVLKLPMPSEMERVSTMLDDDIKEELQMTDDVDNSKTNLEDEVMCSTGYVSDISKVKGGVEERVSDNEEGMKSIGLAIVQDGVEKEGKSKIDENRGHESGDNKGSSNDDKDGEVNEHMESLRHVDDFSGIQNGCEMKGENIINKNRVLEVEGGGREGKSNGGNDFEHNKGIQSPGDVDDFYGSPESGESESGSIDDVDHVKDDGNYEILRSKESGIGEDVAKDSVAMKSQVADVEREIVDDAKHEVDKADDEIRNSEDGDYGEGESTDSEEAELNADIVVTSSQDDDDVVWESIDVADEEDDSDYEVASSQEDDDNVEGEIKDTADDGDSEGNEDVGDPYLITQGKEKELELYVKTVYLKGLTKSWDVKKLKEICKEYGEIENIRLPRKFGGRRMNFGFVVFTCHESALACVKGINNAQFGEGETKVKAELARQKCGNQLAEKSRGTECHTTSKGDKKHKIRTGSERSEENGKKATPDAKEKSQADKVLKSSKEGQSSRRHSTVKKFHDDNPGKRDPRRKGLPLKENAHLKRNKGPDNNKRLSKKSKGNAQGSESFRNSREKPYHRERPVYSARHVPSSVSRHAASRSNYPGHVQSVASGSKRHHQDLEPHAGYIEPAAKKQALHYARCVEPAYELQQQSHAQYYEPAFQNQGLAGHQESTLGRRGRPHVGYTESATGAYELQQQSHAQYYEPAFQNQGLAGHQESTLGRRGRPHVGYTESATGRLGITAYDYSRRRIAGYEGQSSQGSAYEGGSAAVLSSYARNSTSYATYQYNAPSGSYHHRNMDAYLSRRKHD